MPSPEDTSAIQDWLQAELADTLDEDLELELSEPALSKKFATFFAKYARRPSRAGSTLEPCWPSRPS